MLLTILKEHKGNLSVREMSEMTAIKTEDIISTLQSLNLIKYWKGQHIITVSQKVRRSVSTHAAHRRPCPCPGGVRCLCAHPHT